MNAFVLGVSLGVSFIPIFSFPLIYKFGSEKGRIGLFVFVFVAAMILGFVLTQFDISVSSNLMNILEQYGLLIFSVLVIIVFFISYKISVCIYSKKEF